MLVSNDAHLGRFLFVLLLLEKRECGTSPLRSLRHPAFFSQQMREWPRKHLKSLLNLVHIWTVFYINVVGIIKRVFNTFSIILRSVYKCVRRLTVIGVKISLLRQTNDWILGESSCHWQNRKTCKKVSRN
jgi:hypothetical protein